MKKSIAVKVSNWTELLPIINNNVDFARFSIRKLNNKTNLLIFVGAVAAYKAYNRISKLEAEIEMLKNNQVDANETEYSNYWSETLERPDSSEEGEPDVT